MMRQIDAFIAASAALIALFLLTKQGAGDSIKAIAESAQGIIKQLQGG